MGGVDRRGRGAVIDECEPAGVAMREDIHRRSALASAQLDDKRQAMLADASAELGVFVRDLRGGRAKGLNPCFRAGRGADGREPAIDSPGKIHRCRARAFQQCAGALERDVVG